MSTKGVSIVETLERVISEFKYIKSVKHSEVNKTIFNHTWHESDEDLNYLIRLLEDCRELLEKTCYRKDTRCMLRYDVKWKLSTITVNADYNPTDIKNLYIEITKKYIPIEEYENYQK